MIIGIVLFLNGCVVLCFGPFYEETAHVKIASSIIGAWRPIVLEGEDVSKRELTPWQIRNDTVMVYDKHNVSASLDVVFFMLDGHLLCDSTAGKARERDANDFWLYHLLPMHTISKVVRNGDTLTFVPLDYEWLESAVADEKIALPAMLWEDMMLFTASPQEWRAVLKACLAHGEAFNEKKSFVFAQVQGGRST